MGLKQDIIDAKMTAENARRSRMGVEEIQYVPPELDNEAEGIRDAIINFLTSEDLVWTINKLKASVEIEEIDSRGALETEVDTSVNTNVSTAVSTAGTAVAQTGTGTGTGTGEGYGRVTGELNMR